MSTEQRVAVNPVHLSMALAARSMSRRVLAEAMGLKRPDLWRRVAGRSRWRVAEIHLCAELLGVDERWLCDPQPVGSLLGRRNEGARAGER